MINTCIKCNENWKVDQSLITLDNIDYNNLKHHNQLYSICEDCSDNGICVSVEIGKE